VLCSLALDLAHEQRADRAVEGLQQSVALRARVWRDGALVERPARELVPGDVVEISAGSLAPADGEVLQATDCFVNQAMLTGESVPVEKQPGAMPAEPAEALQSPHALLAGSSVVSGWACMRVAATGSNTGLGRMAGSLQQAPPPTEFERGTRRFGMLLMRWTVALVLGVLLLNVLYHRPLLESFLFAVALAVGLTPELLPMIMSVTLARGAVRLSRQQVIVRRLSAIEDLGAMDVLCTDKTGTLTEAALKVEAALDPQGRASDAVLALAWLNSRFETGVKSPLDQAILSRGGADAAAWTKLDEVPFDFERRRVSVLLQHGSDRTRMLVCKGAPEEILRLCTAWDDGSAEPPLDAAARERIVGLFEQSSARGLRLLGVARRRVDDHTQDVSAADEHDFVFAGFIAFVDPPKASTAAALRALQVHGVQLKIITGDNDAVTRHLCGVLGVPVHGVLTGSQIAKLDDHGLRAAVRHANLFCRVTPEQKNRIVLALKANGRVVGYMGDGANDAPPLHSADVGISVDGAVDVARQAADLVLLKQDLHVLLDGVREGRRTVLNIDKYVFMATSSNFGNMMSMAAAALFLPFLPMRPAQVLLNNLLYDVSELALPLDRVHQGALQRPRRFDIAQVRRFMLWFGPLSSAFDLACFAVLLGVVRAGEAAFQTAWFVQSMATQVLVVFVIRTARPAWHDRPSRPVVAAGLGVTALAVALPFTPLGRAFGFIAPAPAVLALVAGLTSAYLLAAEMLKRRFFGPARHRASPLLLHR
jgi:Mg2+-importing ATPase